MNFDDLIGRPFVIGGRPKDGLTAPLDCYGLVQEVSTRLGTALPDRPHHSSHHIISALMSAQISQWQKTAPGVGSVILFRIRGLLCHVGIQVDDFTFLHTWEASAGVCRESLSDWERRIEGHYRYHG